MNATRSMTPRVFPIWLLVLIMLGILIVPALQIATETGVSLHAAVKHGVNASLAQRCKENPESTSFYNPATRRTGIVCLVDGKWAVVIVDQWGKEVTSFVKNKMHTFEQVMKYMRNAGYELLH